MLNERGIADGANQQQSTFPKTIKSFFINHIFVVVVVAGDEFALRDGGSLFCKEDHDSLEKFGQTQKAPTIECINNNNNTNLSNNNHSSELGSMSGKKRKQNIVLLSISHRIASHRDRPIFVILRLAHVAGVGQFDFSILYIFLFDIINDVNFRHVNDVNAIE